MGGEIGKKNLGFGLKELLEENMGREEGVEEYGEMVDVSGMRVNK